MHLKPLHALVLLLLLPFAAQSQVVITSGSDWEYLKGTTNPLAGWEKPGFNASGWESGITPFRYGDGTGGTELTDMQNNYTTLYVRKTFSINVADSVLEGIVFNYAFDDGFKIFINGVEIFQANAPESLLNTSLATASVGDFAPVSVTFSKGDANIVAGENTITAVIYNVATTSSDIYFDLSASLVTKAAPLPKAPEVTYSYPGGYYTNPFNLVLSTGNVGDTIQYTLDCSDPGISPTTKTGTAPLTLKVDPSAMAGRPVTPAVVIRANVKKYGYDVTNSETRTFIFVEKVKSQQFPGSPWPNGNVNDQNMDYSISTDILNDARYKNSIATAFAAIPTVSVVTDNANLFDPTSGIYVNAYNHGDVWERPSSLELIETTNKESFSVGAGLRIRGGYSRNGWNPKHAFRIFFKDEYGKKKLDFPVFGNDAAQVFNKFDLRCAQNYSWSSSHDPMLTYAQDEFCRDVQGLMGQPHTRSRYCHLFLNGLYWGVYEFMERPEANFGASYIGGKKDHFDVIKVATDNNYTVEATDGTMAKWQQVFNLTNKGFASKSDYMAIQGLTADGRVDTSIEKLVDIDNLIDYMINIFYSANFDSPLSIWGNNNNPNNFYAMKNRNEKREGFIFLIHDAEHTLNYIAGNANSNQMGINENRVNIDKKGMSKPPLSTFTPQWLHFRLSENADYRLRFADRAYKYLYHNGIYTPAAAEKIFRDRASQLNMAIIGESLRWGKGLTKDDQWIPAVNNVVNQFMAVRTDILINQLEEYQLLGLLYAPEFKKDGTQLDVQQVTLTKPVTVNIDNPNSGGNVYYTLNGTDPRNINGDISDKAIRLENNAALTVPYPLVLKARILSGNIWSPLGEVLFTNTENRDKIVVSEIQYHAADYGSISDNDLEFIELKNIGDKGVDLGGCYLDSAVYFKFPKGTIINPGGFVVLASDANGFEFLFKTPPTGQYAGSLANEGERIMMFDESNNVLIDFKYQTDFPWPIVTNGSGKSLVASTSIPVTDPGSVAYWAASREKYGSPFSDDDTYIDISVTPPARLVCSVYPNPASDLLTVTSNQAITNIRITDISGKIALEQHLAGQHSFSEMLNLQSLSLKDGLYILNVRTQTGFWNDKLVIKTNK